MYLVPLIKHTEHIVSVSTIDASFTPSPESVDLEVATHRLDDLLFFVHQYFSLIPQRISYVLSI